MSCGGKMVCSRAKDLIRNFTEAKERCEMDETCQAIEESQIPDPVRPTNRHCGKITTRFCMCYNDLDSTFDLRSIEGRSVYRKKSDGRNALISFINI